MQTLCRSVFSIAIAITITSLSALFTITISVACSGCSRRFTHVADFMARMVVRNALFFGRDKFSNLLIPWATYTEPEGMTCHLIDTIAPLSSLHYCRVVAHVGLYEIDCEDRKIAYDVYKKQMEHNDRAICEGMLQAFLHVRKRRDGDGDTTMYVCMYVCMYVGETEGFVKILTKKGTDRIIGATIVGPHAGELISEITVAMKGEVGLGTVAYSIHP